jgi:dolichyl-phosphate-mannose--protein O-mannosyl transferase
VFALLTLTCLFNLAYVLRALNASVFLDARDTPAMLTSIVNLFAFGLAAAYGWAWSAADDRPSEDRGDAWIVAALARIPARLRLTPQPAEDFAPFPWKRLDTMLVGAIVAIAAALRFWHLGHPHEIVFDEVHFVGQARHYIHGEQFLDPHPPIAKLLIAAGILMFGDHSWAWRLGNAAMGTILAGVTYPLGRRMFRSRLAGAIAAGLVACDGFFLVDSRIGCIDIVYLTFAAIAYLLMFRFIQSPDPKSRRWILLPLGVALGLCLGSKLYVPGITFLLVGGFILFTLIRPEAGAPASDMRKGGGEYPLRMQLAAGAALMLGSISAIFYLLSFTPHYALGWWGGIANLFRYYKDVMWYEKSVSTATHPYASPWWSWPLMLRPVAYWQNFPPHGDVATIWGAGNPLTWWGVLPAMAITAVRGVERPNITRAFIVIGFLAYFVIWIPIGRILFLYHYMPSVYIGYLALGGVLAGFFNDGAETWESFAILLTLFPVLIVGLGHAVSTYKITWIPSRMYQIVGLPLLAAILIPYLVSIKRPRIAGRIAAAAFLATAIALFIYYLPLWLGTPITREGYYARMWLEGPGLRNWI